MLTFAFDGIIIFRVFSKSKSCMTSATSLSFSSCVIVPYSFNYNQSFSSFSISLISASNFSKADCKPSLITVYGIGA